MPRIRSVKPGFFKNEVLCELSPWHRLAFEGLWMCADREGRMEDRPKRLKAEIFPYDDLDLDAIIWDLTAAGFVIRYERDGVRLIWVPTFRDHQHPRQDEADSVLPSFEPGTGRVKGALSTIGIGRDGTVTGVSLPSDDQVTTKRIVTGVLGLGSGVLDLGTGAAPPPRTCRAQDLVDAWNESTHPPLPRCREITKERRRKIQARMQQRPELADWRAIFSRVQASAFCRGEVAWRDGKASWLADFDWIIANDTNPAKVVEGKYDDRSPPKALIRDVPARSYWQDYCAHEPRCGSPTICENLRTIAAYKAEHRGAEC